MNVLNLSVSRQDCIQSTTVGKLYRKISFFAAMLCVFFCAENISAQFTVGDIITIRSSTTTYLSVNDAGTGITNRTAAYGYGMWKVLGTIGNFKFESVSSPGYYLHVTASNNNTSLSLTTDYEAAVSFAITTSSTNRRLSIQGLGATRYVNYGSSTWRSSSNTTNLTFTVITYPSFKAGDIITMRSSNNHLAATSTTTAGNVTVIAGRSLWKVIEAGYGFKFQNIDNQRYFTASTSATTIGLTTDEAVATVFIPTSPTVLGIKGSTRYLQLNSTSWRSYTSSTSLTFDILSFPFSDGDYVTIGSGTSNYFSVNAAGTGLQNQASPTVNSLWRVIKNDDEYGYRFEDVVHPGNYGNASTSSTTLSFVSNIAESSLLYIINNTMKINESVRFLQLSSSTWRSYTSATTLTFETFVLSSVSFGELKISPESYNFTSAGGNQTFSISAEESEMYTSTSTATKIENNRILTPSNVEFSLTGSNNFTLSNQTSSSVRVNSAPTSEPQAGTLKAAATINGVTRSAFAAVSINKNIVHVRGASGRALLENGMQSVHTNRQVIYMKPGETKTLVQPTSFSGYNRWYRYTTDDAVPQGLSHANATYTSAAYGNYRLNGAPGTTSYTMPASGENILIACDIANYADYIAPSSSNGQVLTEPTLSYRVIYDIRNASEIAARMDTCTNQTGSFMEEYTLIAPHGDDYIGSTRLSDMIRIGPEYKYTDTQSNYYYNAANPVQLTGGTWQWRNVTVGESGSGTFSSPTVYANRLIETQLKGIIPAAANNLTKTYTIEYTLTSGNYNILKITVTYKPKTEIGPLKEQMNDPGTGVIEITGPAIISNEELDKNFQLLAKKDFDYNDGVPYVSGSDNYNNYVYTKPFPWDESTYGFTYHEPGNPYKRVQDANMAYWSEYMFLRSSEYIRSVNTYYDGLTKGYNAINRSGIENGYFVLVDASEQPGKITDLLIDGNFCAGSTLYFSGWIVNLAVLDANYDRLPNLNFVLAGIDEYGNEHPLQHFTSGRIGLGQTKCFWHQVFYEFELSEEKYAQYRFQIFNNGNNGNGNDFGFDDFRMYVRKTPTKSIQALMDCGATGSENTAILGIDYMSEYYKNALWNELDGVSQATILYQWQEEDGTPLDMNNYLNEEGLPSLYGTIRLKKWEQGDPEPTPTFANTAEYFTSSSNIGETDYFYVMEDHTDEEGASETRPVIYIVQRSKLFLEDHTYHSAFARNSDDLAEAACNSRSAFTVRKAARVAIEDGGVQVGLNAQTLCAGREYTVNTQLFAADENGTMVEGYCYSDWYKGASISQEEAGLMQSYLNDFRHEYPTAKTFNQAEAGSYTGEAKAYLLEKQPYFTLYERDVTIRVEKTGEPVIYIVFPIISSARPLSGSDDIGFTFCDDYLRIEFKGTPMLDLGYLSGGSEVVPEELLSEIANVRLSEEVANAAGFEVPVRDTYGNVLNIQTFMLYASTDPAFGETVNYTLNAVNGEGVQTGETLLVAPAENADFKMKPGYTYQFYGQLESDVEDDCSVKSAYFNILVVPDQVVWAPQGENSSWNNDANWRTPDGRPGFAPSAHTDVILKAGNEIWPMLPTGVGKHATGSGAQPYITYDINYEKNTCRNIYFEKGARLVNQEQLIYERAWVDVEVEVGRWVMMAVPLENVVSGDFYVLKSGKAEETFYTEATDPDNRKLVYPFWHSIYNKQVENINYGTKPTPVSSIEWTEPVNILNNPYKPGTGFSLWTEDGTKYPNYDANTTVIVRLPKTADRYYYFGDNDGIITKQYEDITRSEDGNFKLGFDTNDGDRMKVNLKNHEPSSYFLVGNPLIADLDLTLFFAENKALERTVWLYETPSEITVDNQHATIAVSPEFTTGEEDVRFSRYIAPMRSFIVKLLEGESDELDVYFTSTMGNFVSTPVAGGGSAQSRMKSAAKSSGRNNYLQNSTLRIKAEASGTSSTTLIARRESASNNYVPDEDAPMLILEAGITPFAIYTMPEADDTTALSINQLSSIENIMIPLGIRVLDEKAVSTINVKFTGIESFENTAFWLYDAQNDRRAQLSEEMQMQLVATNDLRYFITTINGGTTTSVDDEVGMKGSDAVTVYNQPGGKALVYSTRAIRHIRINNISGQLIRYYGDLDSNAFEVEFPAGGIYILKIMTDAGIVNKKVLIE